MDSVVDAIIEDTNGKAPFQQPILELFSNVNVRSRISPSRLHQNDQKVTYEENVSLSVNSLGSSILQVQIANSSEKAYKSWRYGSSPTVKLTVVSIDDNILKSATPISATSEEPHVISFKSDQHNLSNQNQIVIPKK
jgi:hypothetical protein